MPTVLALIALLLSALSASASEVEPAEGAVLRQVHVEFGWEDVCFSRGYQLAVVSDTGSEDPFEGAEPVADVFVDGLEPRAVITSGLAFGQRYAWRVRALHPRFRRWRSAAGPRAGPWGPTRRFEIAHLPNLPSWSVSEPQPGSVQPGLTIMDIVGFRAPPGVMLGSVAVDRSGAPVWFNRPFSASLDARQLRDGLMSFVDTNRAFATTLAGEVSWSSPIDPTLRVHHEVFPMPNGNFLTVVHDDRTVEIDGQPEEVLGDRIVELDRETNEVVWEWSTFDHYSLEDMPRAELDNGNWTHVNAVVYNERDNSVYISSRNLSRITRIDYDTGEIIYNMGADAVSGDVDFGNGLFLGQHAPELLENGNMLLHDNGIPNLVNNVSRAIELEFDHPRHPTSATVVWEYVIPKFSRIIGDADRLPNGNTLIASGDTAGVVYEVTPGGELTWRLQAQAPFFFYRAERIRQLVVRSKREQLSALIESLRHAVECHVDRWRERRSGG
jgi:outer membrane protein assembly factor BamB